MASLLVRLSTEKERNTSTKQTLMTKTKTRMLLVSVLLASTVWGCGLGTLSSYFNYRECVQKCDEKGYEDDRSKQRCESDCLSRFDWSDSPFVEKKRKSDHDKVMEEYRFRKSDGK